MVTMTSLSKSTKRPTFVVEPQAILKDVPPMQGQKIKFQTERHQYISGFRAQPVPSVQTSSDSISQTHVYSGKIRFADPKTQTRFTPKQQFLGERASKRARVSKLKNDGERSFSVRRPLKIYVPTDAWQLIFQRCDLAFLLKARLVCRAFRDILDRQALWREARMNQYGDEIPERPLAITEFQYARLLVGKGCQVAPCPRRDTRKVYWPFFLRMCEKCFHKVTEVPDVDCQEARSYSEMYRSLEHEIRQTIPSQLPGLLPAGLLRSSRWQGPRGLNNQLRRWQQRHAKENTVVLVAEYEALKLEFNEKVQDDPEYFLFWARLKWGKTWERMSVALELDEMDLSETNSPSSRREEKMMFFAEEALKLDPPMKFAVLQKFAAYHSALETPNAASVRSWNALKTKIDISELRAQAEQLANWEQEALEEDDGSEDDLQQKLHQHRNAGRHWRKHDEYTPEQKVVIDIAYGKLGSLLDVVHDHDVLLMWFDQVRRAYESLDQKPEGLNGDGTRGPYQLMLDDALMIVEDILKPMLFAGADGDDQYKRILSSLRCVGCTRPNIATTYNFRDLIEHSRRAHAGTVAKDSFWYRLAAPVKSSGRGCKEKVAWYQLPWFKSMPALPFHCKATPEMIWNPDVETEYIQYEEEKKMSPVAFDTPVTYQTRIPADDFTSNFCRAVRILIETRLESPYVIKVAFEYAKRNSRPRSSAGTPAGKTTINQLQSLETICARFTSRLDFKFQCQACFDEVTRSGRRRRPPKPQTLSALVTHWQRRHPVDESTCVTERIVLPTEMELIEIMEREDTKLEAEKASVMKKTSRNTESVDPRAAALLETPSIRSCFEKLFVPREEGRTAFCDGLMEGIDTPTSTTAASFSSSGSQLAHFIPESWGQ